MTEPRYCVKCRHHKEDRHKWHECHSPKVRRKLNRVTGERYVLRFRYCEAHREDGFFESLFWGTCGRRGRWYEPKVVDLKPGGVVPGPVSVMPVIGRAHVLGPDFPRIVCLCGSTRFMDAFFEAGWEFTLKGYIVLSIGVCKHIETEDGGHVGEALGQEVADKLDELHLRKIDLADEVFVLNVDGYIGESTSKEIAYAEKTGKPVLYLETCGSADDPEDPQCQ